MPFKKGKSGNLKGRPKGAMNVCGKEMRENLNLFIRDNFSSFKTDYNQLTPKDRTRVFCDLLQYVVSKLESVKLDSEFDVLSNSQLDAIIDNITKN